MRIETTKSFDKQYAKLDGKIQLAFKKKLEIYTGNQFDPQLRNHALTGKYIGYRSIDVTGDFRALYTIKDNILTIFAFIGTHSQLY